MLRLQGDGRLVALMRAGHDRAFEVLFDRYHARLLAFCRHMLASSEDAEDVLQEVFTNAHKAILADERPINVRPWLYRIARNRCLNHLRKPVPEGQDSMDVHPHEGGRTTAERVQTREDFRALVADVQDLPETQRTALLLREIDALSYEEVATAMDTTVPAVKSLLVRARMSLAEATQSRVLTCGDVQLELAEAAEGLRKASGAVRHHVRGCEECRQYRAKLRSNDRELAALAPAVLLVWLHKAFGANLFGLGTSSLAGGSAMVGSGGGAAACGGAAIGGGAAATASSAAGGLGGLVCTKAAAGIATAALVTAGAVEVRHLQNKERDPSGGPEAAAVTQQGAPAPLGTAPVAAAAAGDHREEAGDGDAREAGQPQEEANGSQGDQDESEPAAKSAPEPAAAEETLREEAPESTDESRSSGADATTGEKRKRSRRGRRASGSGIKPVPLPKPQPCETSEAEPTPQPAEASPSEPADDPASDAGADAGTTQCAPDGSAPADAPR